MNPSHQVDIIHADDPLADETMILDPGEIIEKFPWAQDLIEADRDFSADVTIGLTRIRIYPLDWPLEE